MTPGQLSRRIMKKIFHFTLMFSFLLIASQTMAQDGATTNGPTRHGAWVLITFGDSIFPVLAAMGPEFPTLGLCTRRGSGILAGIVYDPFSAQEQAESFLLRLVDKLELTA